MEDKKIQEMEVEKMATEEMDKVAGGCAKDIEHFRKTKINAEGKPDSPLEDATACVR